MSNDLKWLLIRKYNSFIVKQVPEGPIFTREPGNVMNIHSHKFSGLTNLKTIDISESNDTIKITTRKTKASPHAVAPAYATSFIRVRSSGRRAASIAASYARRNYRPDLRKAAVARVTALVASQREHKPAPPKKVRGKKTAKKAATSS